MLYTSILDVYLALAGKTVDKLYLQRIHYCSCGLTQKLFLTVCCCRSSHWMQQEELEEEEVLVQCEGKATHHPKY